MVGEMQGKYCRLLVAALVLATVATGNGNAQADIVAPVERVEEVNDPDADSVRRLVVDWMVESSLGCGETQDIRENRVARRVRAALAEKDIRVLAITTHDKRSGDLAAHRYFIREKTFAPAEPEDFDRREGYFENRIEITLSDSEDDSLKVWVRIGNLHALLQIEQRPGCLFISRTRIMLLCQVRPSHEKGTDIAGRLS